MALRLRPYRIDDESSALAIRDAMLADDFHFLLSWREGMAWPEFLTVLESQRWGVNLAPGQVRAVQLVAEVNGELVGRTSIRFELNEFLSTVGGHVGYGVAPAHRRKGYATEILRQSLVVLRADGVQRALVTCDELNVGSARAIEANGGVLESVVSDGGGPGVCRYWIS